MAIQGKINALLFFFFVVVVVIVVCFVVVVVLDFGGIEPRAFAC